MCFYHFGAFSTSEKDKRASLDHRSLVTHLCENCPPPGLIMEFANRDPNAAPEPDSDGEEMAAAAPRRRGAGAAGIGASDEVNAAAEAAAAAKIIDDEKHDPDIRGAEGEYPWLPDEHQWLERPEGSDVKECDFGGVEDTETSEEWKRLIISAKERTWKSCISANFRVVDNRAPSTCRHLFHAGILFPPYSFHSLGV